MVSSKVVPRAGNDLSERSKHSKQMKQPEGAQIKKREVYLMRKRKNDYLNFKRMMSFPFSESVWHQTWVQLASVCQIVITVGGEITQLQEDLAKWLSAFALHHLL